MRPQIDVKARLHHLKWHDKNAAATMFEQAFKNIDDVLWKDAGCTSELDYTEQTSWLLFLKYLDALDQDKATEASLDGRKYAHILDKPYRWATWAAPKGKDCKIDHNAAMTGDDLIQFVNGKLFSYLHGFKANDADLAEFFELQKTKADSPKSWSVDVAAIDSKIFDLSVKNPNGGEEIAHRSPQEIMDEIAALDAESAEVLGGIRRLL